MRTKPVSLFHLTRFYVSIFRRKYLPKKFTTNFFLILFGICAVLCSFYLISIQNVPIFRKEFATYCRYQAFTTPGRIAFDESLDHLINYPEFVCPQNFRNLADWIFGWPNNVFDEKLEYPTYLGRVIVPNLPAGSIIYVKTDSLPTFFSKIYDHLKHDFVLITAQGDASAPAAYLNYLNDPKSKIMHWFGQNGDIEESTNRRFTHLPIGINCYEMAEGIRMIHSLGIENRQKAISPGSLDEPSFYIQPIDISQSLSQAENQSDPLVLLNFNSATDPTGHRKRMWKIICNNETHPYAVCLEKPDGVQIEELFKIYQRNRQYPFWLSPRGNGLDSHRTWEALYLDIIPIVWHSTLDPIYRDLPVMIINDISDLNEDNLRLQLRQIVKKKLQTNSTYYRYEKLRNAFWKEMILEKSRHSLVAKHLRKNLCWRGKVTRRKARSLKIK